VEGYKAPACVEDWGVIMQWRAYRSAVYKFVSMWDPSDSARERMRMKRCTNIRPSEWSMMIYTPEVPHPVSARETK
jgi:hypothetical protein